MNNFFKLFHLFSLLFLSIVALPNVYAAPAQVIIIRHAEKPLGEEGIELSARGWQRSHALVYFFSQDPRVIEFGPPVAIYGMAPKDEDGSIRSIQTVMPLASHLGIRVIDDFSKKDYQEMVYEIMQTPQYRNHTVVICWAHDKIDNLAREFSVVDAPKWEKVYDRAWIIKFKRGKVIDFLDIPQRLLPGDASN